MTAFDRLRDRIVEMTGLSPRQVGGQWQFRCPAHEDRNPSLSARPIEGSVLLCCRAGCDTRDVLAALNLTERDLYDNPRGDELTRYVYRDANGSPARVVHRKIGKDFPQSGDKSLVQLYRLPEVIAAVAAGTTVHLVEGEKDTLAVESAGGVATTAPMGAANFDKVDVSPLKGATVIAVRDRDADGMKWSAEVRRRLDGYAASLQLVEAKVGKDAADHIAAGHGLDDFAHVAIERAEARELEFLSLKELCARVDAAGPRQYLLRGIWPAGDYGVHAGPMKTQKTWNVVDLVVAAVTRTPWLGLVEVDLSGPVLMFVGEGGEANLVRRIRAVAQGIPIEDLPIVICTRAPHLSDPVHLGLMADQLDHVRPVLTSIDPAYLALGGAKGSDLYAMGAILERPQHMCAEVGSALAITTHHNRADGRGAIRITGAGPAEWGRVLINATAISRHTDPATQESTVITELDIIGGEVPDRTLRVVRRIRAEHPDDLDSPLHYGVDATYATPGQDAEDRAMPPARKKLLDALRAAAGTPARASELVDWIAREHGHGLTRETVSRELNALARDGHADRIDQGIGKAAQWYITNP